MKTKKNIILLVIIFILFGCYKSQKINYHTFLKNTWFEKDKIEFSQKISDSSKIYSLYISIRHTTEYRYDNIIMFLHHKDEKKNIMTDTIEINLMDDKGKPIGLGKNDIREIEKLINKKKYLKGNHIFELELAMRKKNNKKIKKLEHIKNISVYIQEENE